jgi:acyl-CoA hydrolase
MTQIVMPSHTNGVGGVLFGGMLVQWIDVCAGVAAMRHCAGSAVTASIDRLDFLVPIHVGDVVVLQAQVNYAGKTSMEVGCRVETEDLRSGERRYTTKAYLTFVALDANDKPRPIPRLVPRTAEEKRRYAEAQQRRTARLALAGKSDVAPQAKAPRARRTKTAQPSSRTLRSSRTRA